MQKFWIGERVRDLSRAKQGGATVIHCGEQYAQVRFDSYAYKRANDYHTRDVNELERVEDKPKTQFEVGDRVRDRIRLNPMGEGCIVDFGGFYGAVPEKDSYRIRFDTFEDDYQDTPERKDFHVRTAEQLELVEEKPKFKVGPNEPTRTFYCDGVKIVGFDEVVPFDAKKVDQALRFNSGKPESDYIFTYQGGVRAAFGEDFDFFDTFQELGELYRSRDAHPYVGAVLDALQSDFEECGRSLIEHLTITNTYGSKKYAQGNYLKGANYRQYFQSLARHGEAIVRGEDRDDEGNDHYGAIAFNVLMLCHCFTTGIGVDDRIRAPK